MRHTKIFLFLLLCNSPLVAEESTDQYIDISVANSQGDFNTGQKTELLQLQVTYGQVIGEYDFSIAIPYLFLSDSFGDESGLGDITLRAGTTLSGNNLTADNIYASISVKLPTADEASGLGTGESDIGGFISYTHNFNVLSLTLMGGYIVTGDSQAQSYEDIFVYGVGLSKIITPWYVYGSLDGRQQILETGDDPLELSGGFFYQLESGRFFKMDVFVGLNNSSSDTGFSVGIVNWF